MDQAHEAFRFDPSLRNYKRRIAGKTAALFALSGHIGAREGGAPREVAHRLGRIGYNLGMGFQIRDDILDFTSTSETLGKPVGTDLREGNTTLPLIYALREGEHGIARKLASIRPDRPLSGRDIRAAAGLIRMGGYTERAEETAAGYTAAAMKEIDRLPAGEPAEILSHLVMALDSRSS
jgi:heptaprenyl diphosphate synthase